MNWMRQVGHVFAKDVRHARWYLAAWAAAAVLAGIAGLAPIVPSFATFDVLGGVVFLLGVLTVAGTVQSDSATAVGSYWTTLPLSSTAVLAAKLLLAIVIVLLPTIVAFLMFGSLGVPAGAAAPPILMAAAGGGLCVLALFVIAALTRGLREFLLAAILIPFAALLLPNLVQWILRGALDFDDLARGVPTIVALLAASGALLVLLHLYRRRDLRRTIWAPALFLVIVAMATPPMRSTASAAAAPMPGHPALEFHMAPDPSAGPLTPYRGTMSVSVEGAPADLRVQLMAEASVLHLRDGRTVRMGRRPQLITPHPATVAVFHGMRWPYADPDGGATFVLAPDPQAPPPPIGAVASVDVFAEVRLWRLVPLGTLPLAPGASLQADGGRIRIMAFAHGADSALVTTRVLTATAGPNFTKGRLLGLYGQINMTLINETRHEALALSQAGMTGGDVWLVLPGVRGRDYDIKYGAKRAAFSSASAAPNDQWYAGAHVQLAAWVWLPSYYQIHLVYTSPTGEDAATSQGDH